MCEVDGEKRKQEDRGANLMDRYMAMAILPPYLPPPFLPSFLPSLLPILLAFDFYY